jgi:hypothetical protein
MAFVCPGFLHLFGNLVFTIQGNALALPEATRPGESGLTPPQPGSGGRERQAILLASERAGKMLRLWRWLLGDPLLAAEPAAELLAALGEVLRVPLREARQGLQLLGLEQATGQRVEAATFALALCSAVQTLLRELPHGIEGTVVLTLVEGPDNGLRVRLQFAPPAGTLPFPILAGALMAAMPTGLPGRPAPQLQPIARGVELRFAVLGGGLGRRPQDAVLPTEAVLPTGAVLPTEAESKSGAVDGRDGESSLAGLEA